MEVSSIFFQFRLPVLGIGTFYSHRLPGPLPPSCWSRMMHFCLGFLVGLPDNDAGLSTSEATEGGGLSMDGVGWAQILRRSPCPEPCRMDQDDHAENKIGIRWLTSDMTERRKMVMADEEQRNEGTRPFYPVPIKPSFAFRFMDLIAASLFKAWPLVF